MKPNSDGVHTRNVWSGWSGFRFRSAAIRLAAITTFCLFCAAAALAQTQGYGAPSKFVLKSAVLGEERTILIRTPAGYETNKLRYPVLYMTDGDAHIGHTSGTVEFLARNGRMSELIIVGITNTDRTRDLTPTKTNMVGADGNPINLPTAGGADNFLKFVETELIPEIEKRYRVEPYRILAGHSLGGLFAIYSMISRPNLFNSYVAVSPSLQWDDQLVVKRTEEFLKTHPNWTGSLYVSLGNEPGPIGESFKSFKAMLERTKVKGLEWEAQQMEDEDHGSVVLRSHYAGLRKVYSGWQMPRDANGAVAGGLKGADEHYQWLSKKFGYTIPTPELLINQIGYQYLFAGQPEDAIATFKANVERFPESANVYDSLAEAYEKNGHMDWAKPLYEKAAELGQRNNDPNLAIYKTNFARAADKLKEAETAKKNQK